MKTNRRKPFILATLALGLVLVMGLGANTFAKYLTQDSKSATAKVAKWGYSLSITNNLFSDEYLNEEQVISDTKTDAASVDVQAATLGQNLIAPGTNGSLTVVIGSTPSEVDSSVTVTCSITDIPAVSPLTWKLTKNGAEVAEGVTAIQDYLTGLSVARVEAGVAYANVGTYVLSWEWPFDGDDVRDTELGVAGSAEISVSVGVTIAQIQGTTPVTP